MTYFRRQNSEGINVPDPRRTHDHDEDDDDLVIEDGDAVIDWADLTAEMVERMLARSAAMATAAMQELVETSRVALADETRQRQVAAWRSAAAMARLSLSVTPIPRRPRRAAWATPGDRVEGMVSVKALRRSRLRASATAAAAGLAPGRPLPIEHSVRLRRHLAALDPGEWGAPQQHAAHRRRMEAFDRRTDAGRPTKSDIRLLAEILGAERDALLARDLRGRVEASRPGATDLRTAAMSDRHAVLRDQAADRVRVAWDQRLATSTTPVVDGRAETTTDLLVPVTASLDGHRNNQAIIWTNGPVVSASQADRLAWLLEDAPGRLHGNAKPIRETIISFPPEIMEALKGKADTAVLDALRWWATARAAALGITDAHAVQYGHLDSDAYHLHELRSAYLPNGEKIETESMRPVNACIDAMLARLIGGRGDLDAVGLGWAADAVYERMAAGESVVRRIRPDGSAVEVDMSPEAIAARVWTEAGVPPAILAQTGPADSWAKRSWSVESLPRADQHNAKSDTPSP